jgi:protein SCO1
MNAASRRTPITRVLPLFSLVLAATVVLLLLFMVIPRAQAWRGVALDSAEPLAGLHFVTDTDRAVEIEDFRGRVTLVYFGYTNCPDVCPTTLGDVSRALQQLGADARDVQVVFVSVDPDRDAPARVANYAHAFHPDFIGVTGDPEQIADAAARLGVHYEKSGGDGSAAGYAMAHTASVTVLDRAGRPKLIFPYGMSSDAMAADLRALVRATGATGLFAF